MSGLAKEPHKRARGKMGYDAGYEAGLAQGQKTADYTTGYKAGLAQGKAENDRLKAELRAMSQAVATLRPIFRPGRNPDREPRGYGMTAFLLVVQYPNIVFFPGKAEGQESTGETGMSKTAFPLAAALVFTLAGCVAQVPQNPRQWEADAPSELSAYNDADRRCIEAYLAAPSVAAWKKRIV